MIADGKAFVRIAQLRGRIAALARGGRYDLTLELLGDLVRADLGLGLPADALLRARQSARLAEERGEPIAGSLVVLAATLLSANAFGEAVDAAALAIDRAVPAERARIETMARLVGGAGQRRLGRFAEARILLDAARGAAARLGERSLAGFALAELAWVDLAEDRPAAAATCFEFAAEFLRRAEPDGPAYRSSVDCEALAVAAWATADELERATERAAVAADTARAAQRFELIAYVDGVLADLALRAAPDAAAEACALAAESATTNAEALAARPPSTDGLERGRQNLARELVAQARLRQVRTADASEDRARHLEAGIELALALERPRASARLGAFLFDLVDDAERAAQRPVRGELERLAGAIAGLGDQELTAMARAVLAEL
ncbi:MAG: hypothetical protein ABI591_02625 [Kofleriaceae bacterium]